LKVAGGVGIVGNVYAGNFFYANGAAVSSAGSVGYTGSAGSGYTGSAGSAGTTGYTGSIGTSGNIGYTGSAGAAGTNATGTTTFVATGTIASGKTVALNSDGTVSIVQQADTALSIGTTTTLPSINALAGTSSAHGQSYMSMLYNSTDNVVYVIYRSGYNSRITIEIGTVSGTTITFGSFSADPSSTNYGQFISAHWNAATNKILIISSGTQYAYGMVVTPTPGPGVTWNANWIPQLINNSSLLSSRLVYHQSQGSYLFLYVLGTNGSTNTLYGMVLTVSGTTISAGSQTQIVTNGNNLYFDATYDATNSQVIAAYGITTGGYVIPVTVSSNTISPGSSTQFTSDLSYDPPVLEYNNTGNNVVIVYTDSSSRYQAIAATKSGSTFTFGSKTLINAPNNNNGSFHITYDYTAGRYLFIYNSGSTGGFLCDLAVSGTTITVGPTTTLNSNIWMIDTVYVASLGKVLFSYGVYNGSFYAAVATGVVVGATNASNWIGISSNSASNGGAVSVTTLGGVNSAVTGLTTNSTYYLTASGNLSVTATSYSKVGIATAANKILITNAAVTGYTGSTGTTGNVGYTGSAGTAGSAGSTGYTGSAGSTGIGYTGSAGSGYTGSQGAAGNTGTMGYTGSVGTFSGTTSSAIVTTNSTASTSTSTGALQVSGGAGIAGNVYAGAVYTGGLYWSSNGAVISTGGSGVTGGYLNMVMTGAVIPPVVGIARLYPPVDMTVTTVYANLSSAPVNGNMTFVIKKNGTSTGTTFTLSTTLMSPVTVSIALTTADYLTIDVAGSSSADLRVTLKYV
jgi:hypothetical protein